MTQIIYLYKSRKTKAFIPEADAYTSLFKSLGLEVRIGSSLREAVLEAQFVMFFFGFIPRWSVWRYMILTRNRPLLIGEYHSLSTGPLRRTKDIVKRAINVRCSFYIFLNESVRKRLHFSDRVPHGYRPMGFDPERPKRRSTDSAEFDFVYAGTMNYKGTAQLIEALAAGGMSILVIGSTREEFEYGLRKAPEWDPQNIVWIGRIPTNQIAGHLVRARTGINAPPLEEPFIWQDSTKVVEYVASGLRVLTTQYEWIDDFMKHYCVEYCYWEQQNLKSDMRWQVSSGRQPITQLEWPKIIEESGILAFLRQRTSAE